MRDVLYSDSLTYSEKKIRRGRNLSCRTPLQFTTIMDMGAL